MSSSKFNILGELVAKNVTVYYYRDVGDFQTEERDSVGCFTAYFFPRSEGCVEKKEIRVRIDLKYMRMNRPRGSKMRGKTWKYLIGNRTHMEVLFRTVDMELSLGELLDSDGEMRAEGVVFEEMLISTKSHIKNSVSLLKDFSRI